MKQAEQPTAPRATFAVAVIDMYHHCDPDEQRTIEGFATVELAREYARRRTRDSLEELRPSAPDPKDLGHQWHAFGEDCCVIGGYCGAHELDFFIANPASAVERDWAALTPDPGMRALLTSAGAAPRNSLPDTTRT
jgi:hypothetical protein